MFNKRASLEISIQAIVIVVLAMTLLGLGLGFVRGMFKNITGTTDDVTEQVKNKILDDLIQGDKRISFPKTEILLDKGGSTVLTVGVRNKGDTELKYRIKFTPVSGPATVSAAELAEFRNYFQYNNQEYTLPAADTSIRNVRLSLPTSVRTGSYFLTFDIEENDVSTGTWRTYDQKDFFVVVRG